MPPPHPHASLCRLSCALLPPSHRWLSLLEQQGITEEKAAYAFEEAIKFRKAQEVRPLHFHIYLKHFWLKVQVFVAML